MVKMLQSTHGRHRRRNINRETGQVRKTWQRPAWVLGKEFYSEEIKDIKEAVKCTESEKILANNTVASSNNNTLTEDIVHNKIVHFLENHLTPWR